MIADVAAANNVDVVGMIDGFVGDTEGVTVGGIVTAVKGAEVGGAFSGIDGIVAVEGLSVDCIVGNSLHVVSNVVDIVIGC